MGEAATGESFRRPRRLLWAESRMKNRESKQRRRSWDTSILDSEFSILQFRPRRKAGPERIPHSNDTAARSLLFGLEYRPDRRPELALLEPARADDRGVVGNHLFILGVADRGHDQPRAAGADGLQ